MVRLFGEHVAVNVTCYRLFALDWPREIFMNLNRFLIRIMALFFELMLMAAVFAAPGNTERNRLYEQFVNPPDSTRIMMRWWWFGPAVTRPELERELRVMKSAGIGGVEIQPVYPLELDDPQAHFHNLPYLSDEFLDDVGFTSRTAKQLGMRVDVTLGSGWPYGGPDTPVTQAAGRLRADRAAVPANVQSLPIPAMENGEKLIAVFLANGDARSFSFEGIQRLTIMEQGRVRIPSGLNGSHTALFFISSRTGQQVKRPGVDAEGFVLDHYDKAAVEHHLNAVGNRLLRGFGTNPPYAVFSDSLEVFGSDWSSDFLSEFRKRRGYDLLPDLPALVGDMGEQTRAIRHDWGKTLTELADEHYLTPIREWAHAHHTLFRSQTYGEPPVILSSNALVDLPEGEMGPHWRGFSAARWASSASHLYGRPITSTETWTWLHSPAFRATPLDMKAEADLHFIEGINQLIGHGWPYSPESAGEPGWRFYASAAFNDHNPWFQVMPEITKYLQRVSYLLRQGAPANDVAIYLPTDDAWADFRPGRTSVDRSMDSILGPALIPQVLNAGYNFDFIDDRAIAAQGVPYRILIVPGVERIPLVTLEKLQSYVQNRGMVVATRRLPSLAPGLMEDKTDTPHIVQLSQELFETSPKGGRFVRNEQSLGSTLNEMLLPDFSAREAAPVIGFIHRKLDSGELYFVANTSNQPVDTEARVRVAGLEGEWWNPFTGEATSADCRPNGNATIIRLRLAPYESRVIVFRKTTAVRRGDAVAETANSQIMDVSPNWNVTFSGLRKAVQMTQLRSWTDDPETQFYSGQAVYEKTVAVSKTFLKPATKILIDFGPGEAIQPDSRSGPGMRALLESPVRESALVYLNGERAGAVWHPPYELDITRFLRAGENRLRIVVANLAINEMAGRALPNYRLLNLRYGERFTPQGFEDLKSLPSGILGQVHLVAR